MKAEPKAKALKDVLKAAESAFSIRQFPVTFHTFFQISRVFIEFHLLRISCSLSLSLQRSSSSSYSHLSESSARRIACPSARHRAAAIPPPAPGRTLPHWTARPGPAGFVRVRAFPVGRSSQLTVGPLTQPSGIRRLRQRRARVQAPGDRPAAGAAGQCQGAPSSAAAPGLPGH